MENRLHELRNGTSQKNFIEDSEPIGRPNKHSDIGESQVVIEEQNDLMPEFTQQTDQAQRLIEQIRANNERIENLKSRYQKATTSVAEKGIDRNHCKRSVDSLIAQQPPITSSTAS